MLYLQATGYVHCYELLDTVLDMHVGKSIMTHLVVSTLVFSRSWICVWPSADMSAIGTFGCDMCGWKRVKRPRAPWRGILNSRVPAAAGRRIGLSRELDNWRTNMALG